MGAITDSFNAAAQQLEQLGTVPASDSIPPGNSDPSPSDNSDPGVIAKLEAAGVDPQTIETIRQDTMSKTKFNDKNRERNEEVARANEAAAYYKGQAEGASVAPAADAPDDGLRDVIKSGFAEDDQGSVDYMSKVMEKVIDITRKNTLESVEQGMAPTRTMVRQAQINSAEGVLKKQHLERFGPEIEKYWNQMWGTTVQGLNAGQQIDPATWLWANHGDEATRMAAITYKKRLDSQKPGLEAHSKPARRSTPLSEALGGNEPLARGDKPRPRKMSDSEIYQAATAEMANPPGGLRA